MDRILSAIFCLAILSACGNGNTGQEQGSVPQGEEVETTEEGYIQLRGTQPRIFDEYGDRELIADTSRSAIIQAAESVGDVAVENVEILDEEIRIDAVLQGDFNSGEKMAKVNQIRRSVDEQVNGGFLVRVIIR
ncbi:hypothetical protein ERJ70_17255 [Sediminibacillus dalangtanensis]|uniref:Sporulation lipoprotein YhcN/YlaJ (Spore_YhcN_YlaJ) n=1 Tax=Sediminibacillus dalangtanensis TaxID=2729421 RepID=A0ABX7VV72_9BACI|nr:hypothetical protein [Sediminibacillus dalangtanensis]QTN00878.1 hypothetical protein ERJ70_17255 [Sediminibacillus dalangtanensis]